MSKPFLSLMALGAVSGGIVLSAVLHDWGGLIWSATALLFLVQARYWQSRAQKAEDGWKAANAELRKWKR